MRQLLRWALREIGMSETKREDPAADCPGRRRTTCSFCGRSSAVAGEMVEGPDDVYICYDCAEIAYGIFLQRRARQRIWPDPRHPAHETKRFP
jgi:hypothetical protein